MFLGELRGAGVDLYLDRQGVDTSTTAGKTLFQIRCWAYLRSSSARSFRNGSPQASLARARRVQRAGRHSAGRSYHPARGRCTSVADGCKRDPQNGSFDGTGNATVAKIAAEMRAS